jgi:hypothetical protein
LQTEKRGRGETAASKATAVSPQKNNLGSKDARRSDKDGEFANSCRVPNSPSRLCQEHYDADNPADTGISFKFAPGFGTRPLCAPANCPQAAAIS